MAKLLLRELVEKLDRVEIGAIKDAPREEVRKGDVVVGELTDDLKRLYGLVAAEAIVDCEEMVKKAMRVKDLIMDEKPFDDYKEEFEDAEKLFAQLSMRRDFLCRLFWASVRNEFPELTLKPSVALRKGWKVVWNNDEQDSSRSDSAEVGEAVIIPVSTSN